MEKEKDKSNKMYVVIRKHPKKDNKFDLTVGRNYYKKGETVSHKIFLQVYGNEAMALKAIEDMIEAKFIKEYTSKKDGDE